ncbi:MAG: hypothetical protein HWN81_16775 [Candidatus Lokiarchaeota archaeon]|nr:hypothetical protein [Candidatus Lokiarchaeota archaeon]
MAICGFCKQKVEFKGALLNFKKQLIKKGSTEGNSNMVLMELERNKAMYYCPHCDSVLGFHS